MRCALRVGDSGCVERSGVRCLARLSPALRLCPRALGLSGKACVPGEGGASSPEVSLPGTGIYFIPRAQPGGVIHSRLIPSLPLLRRGGLAPFVFGMRNSCCLSLVDLSSSPRLSPICSSPTSRAALVNLVCRRQGRLTAVHCPRRRRPRWDAGLILVLALALGPRNELRSMGAVSVLKGVRGVGSPVSRLAR